MSNRNLSFGTGVPRNWSSRLGIDFGERAAGQEVGRSRGVSKIVFALDAQLAEKFVLPRPPNDDPVRLVAPAQDLTRWDVRDQGRRATCTAFAVTAMEELWHATFVEPGVFLDLSEEFLYFMSRENTFADVGVQLGEAEVDALTRSGATFLKQAKVALQDYGICAEDEARYNRRAAMNARLKPTQPAEQDAMRRKPTTQYIHNIVDVEKSKTTVGDERAWKNGLTGARVTDIFLEAINNNLAIAAGFAVLNGTGQAAWLGSTPFLTGHVKYPDDTVAAGLNPIGGHAVCIVGFVADETGRAIEPNNPGWFIFRNSLGQHRFARDAVITAVPPASSLPGYGLISAADVDRYCWEYMFRKAPANRVSS